MNKCGECNVCCTVCEIKELDKPVGTLCAHYNNGCTIHDRKPTACKNFKCLYYQQNMPEKYRPDHLGVMFEKPSGFLFWVGVEVVPGAIKSQDCLNVVKALERDNSVCALQGLDGNNYHNLLPNMTIADFDLMLQEAQRNIQEI